MTSFGGGLAAAVRWNAWVAGVSGGFAADFRAGAGSGPGGRRVDGAPQVELNTVGIGSNDIGPMLSGCFGGRVEIAGKSRAGRVDSRFARVIITGLRYFCLDFR